MYMYMYVYDDDPEGAEENADKVLFLLDSASKLQVLGLQVHVIGQWNNFCRRLQEHQGLLSSTVELLLQIVSGCRLWAVMACSFQTPLFQLRHKKTANLLGHCSDF